MACNPIQGCSCICSFSPLSASFSGPFSASAVTPYHLQFLADGMYTAMAEGTVFVSCRAYPVPHRWPYNIPPDIRVRSKLRIFQIHPCRFYLLFPYRLSMPVHSQHLSSYLRTGCMPGSGPQCHPFAESSLWKISALSIFLMATFPEPQISPYHPRWKSNLRNTPGYSRYFPKQFDLLRPRCQNISGDRLFPRTRHTDPAFLLPHPVH